LADLPPGSITDSVTSPPPPTTLILVWLADCGSDDRSIMTLSLPLPVTTVMLLPGPTTCDDSTLVGLFASNVWTRSILTVWSPVVETSFSNWTTTLWVGWCGCSEVRSTTTGSALKSMRGSSWSKISFGAGPGGATRCETEDLSSDIHRRALLDNCPNDFPCPATSRLRIPQPPDWGQRKRALTQYTPIRFR
jgi:hypothetical protein